MKRTTIIAALALLATAGTASVLAAKGGWHEGRHQGRGHHDEMGKMGFGGGKGAMRELRNMHRADADRDGAVTLDEYLKAKTADFAAMDKNSDGAVSGDELVADMVAAMSYRSRAMLKQLDTNLDGKVTKDDFVSGARQRFAERDLNGDGVIDRNDMRPARGGKWDSGGKWDKSDERRDAAADDKDDERAADDVAGRDEDDDRGHGRRGRHGGWGKSASIEKFVERAERAFTRMDVNNDGEINAADFEPRHSARIDFAKQKRLASLDKDRDGKVTLDEFLAGPKDRFARLDLDGDGKITAADLPPRMAERWTKPRVEAR
ncbi:MAG: EF-hand domain-containing protein [Hyphomicrobiaceae bacterium]